MSPRPWMRNKQPLFGVSVPGDGPSPARVMLVADRPGKQDPAAGRPFTAAAGSELKRYLALAGLTRDEVYVTHIVKDYRDDEPTEEEVARDLPELLEEIDRCNPDIICPLGRFAIRFFLGDVDVEQVHGLAHLGDDHGWPGTLLYPAFHPAAGLHSGDAIPFIHDDFLGLADVWSRLLPVDEYATPVYRRRMGTDLLDPARFAAVDSEGHRHDPWSLQISQAPGSGLVIPGDHVESMRGDWNRFWSAGGRLLLHNSLHDLQVIHALGLPIRDGQFIDTMVLAYLIKLLPQGLKSLAYRIAGMKMEGYEEVVGPAKQIIEEGWLAGALAVADDIAPPELELVWDDKTAAWRVRTPHSIARRLRAIEKDITERGKTVDIAARVRKWEDSAAGELREVCGDVPEPTLNDIPRADAERYACRDADATLRIAPYLIERVKTEGMWGVAEIDHAILPMVDHMQQAGMLIDPEHFRRLDEQWTQEMSDVRDSIEEMVGARINPSSPDQVAALLFKQLGLPSRKLTKGGEDSTNDKVLESLRSYHPVLPLIMEYRELDKMRGSFCRKMLKLAGPDNRVRGNIRVTRVESGRLAMNSPNLMAIPVRMARGRKVREGFIARPGCVIGSWDLDQIEMREIADLSQDEFLIELFRDASRDIHSETAGRMFDKDPAEVDAKTERYAAKRVGFGIATQITGRGLVDQMELAGARHADGGHWTEAECDHLIELWFGVYPGVRRLIDRVKAECRRTGLSQDRWGRIRHLEGVWSTVERIREEALRAAPSHKISAGAQGVMKRNMATIWRRLKEEGLIEMGVWPILQIHDSLMLEYPEELHPMVDEIVMEGMEETCAADYCIPITASGERGYNWGKMEIGEEEEG